MAGPKNSGPLTIIAAVVLLAAAAAPLDVQAQVPPPDGLDVQLFRVAASGNDYVTQYGADVPGHLGYGVGIFFSYQRNPLVIYTRTGGGDPRDGSKTAVVKDFMAAEIFGYLGLTKHLAFGLSMPLGLYMTGEVPADPVSGGTPRELETFAWGDVAVHIKGRIYHAKSAHMTFAGVLSVSAPTGKYAENYLGEDMVALIPRFVTELKHKKVSAAVNLGAVLRTKPVKFYDGAFEVGQQFLYGAAFAFRVHRQIRLLAEVNGRTAFTTIDGSPLEAGGAVQWRIWKGLQLDVGATGGAVAGIGTPEFRVYLGMRWAPATKDSDGDGVPDEDDRCPGQLEDRDGFADHDGCPDRDNDRDSIPDTRDKCKNAAEDYDGYADEDGCPDPDNDGDGVCDNNPGIQRMAAKFASTCSGKDNCPMHKGPKKFGGCPESMLDVDNDGIPDAKDRCRQQAEDKDGFQDEDGCPDPDNDGDGVCDDNSVIQEDLDAHAKVCKGKDLCPKDQEDRDGYKDDDGCPDPDDDGDGVCDNNPQVQKNLSRYRSICIGADRCPKRKETINGRRDQDGCPDRGSPGVVVRGKQVLTPGGRIAFKRKSTRFARKTRTLLLQLAAVLRTRRRDIKRLVIVGFTEPRMSRAVHVSQAWAEAVKAFLVGRGIAGSRLMARGLGGVKPVYTGGSRSTSKKINRRVEFYIVTPKED